MPLLELFLSHSVLAGGLLEAIPVGDEGGDHYLVVPVDFKVAIDRATSFYHWQNYLIECYSSYHKGSGSPSPATWCPASAQRASSCG